MTSETFIDLFSKYGYGVLLPVSIIEGPVVTLLAGFLSSAGILALPLAYAVAVLGDLLGDTLYYALGRCGGRSLLLRWGPRLKIRPEHLKWCSAHFQNHTAKTLLFGKTQVWGGAILVAAGIAHVPPLTFLAWNFLASLVKTGALVLAGFYFGKAVGVLALSRYVDWLAAAALVSGGVTLKIFFSRSPRHFFQTAVSPNQDALR